MSGWRCGAVLFDLDGTLVDSAPDLAAAANHMRARRQLQPLPLALYRPHGGSGARGMLRAGFDLQPGDADYAVMRAEFLHTYSQCMLQHSHVFAQVVPLLNALDGAAQAWGIVTNKAFGLAQPLLAHLGLLARTAVLVGGDSTPHTKPHPAPLLHAASQLGLSPAHCLYVGDDRRDIQAGRSAGMRTAAATWGYLGAGEDATQWQADAVLNTPMEVLPLLTSC